MKIYPKKVSAIRMIRNAFPASETLLRSLYPVNFSRETWIWKDDQYKQKNEKWNTNKINHNLLQRVGTQGLT